MPNDIESYWGDDFPAAEDSVVITLLKQQAHELTRVTHGAVKGVVKESVEGGTTYASLYAAVPSAEDYQFKILYVAHPIIADPTNPFPITVEDSFDKTKRVMQEMKSFDEYLRGLLSSEPIKIAISNMIKYSKRAVEA